MDQLFLDRSDVKALNERRTWRQRKRVCHIPEKGLYFGLRGQVFTCCFNKTFPVGNYPSQSIQEIWEGVQIQEQRKAIKNWDLSKGCAGCHSLIKSRNINGLPIRNYDQYAGRNKGMPSKMDFELYNTCNLECIMCRGEFSSSIRKNREQLPPIVSPYDTAFYDQVEAFLPTLKSSHFLGGEPFLIPEYIDLWDRMATINPKISLSAQTNCTVLNQRVKDILNRIDFHISISLDSVDPDNFARIRKNGKFERVIENLKWFRAYTQQRGTLLTMAMCPMPQNWHELPNAIEFCNEWEMPLMFTTVEAPSHCSLQALPYDELAKIYAQLNTFTPAASTPLQKQNQESYLDLLSQIEKWANMAKTKEESGVTAPAENLKEYISQLTLLLQKEHSKMEASNIANEIRDKLNFVLDFADEKGLRSSAEEKIIATPHELMLRSVPGLERDQLLQLFQSYVMPLEE